MPTYQRISIAVSPQEQREIKLQAHEEGKTISAYCKNKILSDYHINESLDRESVEEQIQALKKEISYLYDATDFLIKKAVWKTEADRHFMTSFFNAVTRNPQKVTEVWKQAEKSADEAVKNLFK